VDLLQDTPMTVQEILQKEIHVMQELARVGVTGSHGANVQCHVAKESHTAKENVDLYLGKQTLVLVKRKKKRSVMRGTVRNGEVGRSGAPVLLPVEEE